MIRFVDILNEHAAGESGIATFVRKYWGGKNNGGFPRIKEMGAISKATAQPLGYLSLPGVTGGFTKPFDSVVSRMVMEPYQYWNPKKEMHFIEIDVKIQMVDGKEFKSKIKYSLMDGDKPNWKLTK